MQLNHQTVLVTGAGGFIGSHLTERLVDLGAETRALVHYNSSNSWGWLDHSPVKGEIEVVMGDVRDRDSLRRAMRGVDTVFHLAALISIPYSYHSPLSYIRTNVEGSLNVLQLALESGAKLVVQTSTSEVYGTARHVPIDENHVLQGQSPYSASKIGADKVAEAFHLAFGLPVATIRPFNTFGPRQSSRAIIPTIITQAQTQPKLHLGSLEPTRDFNYVSDTVEGYIRIAEHAEAAIGQVINIGSGKEITIGELASRILKLLGKDLPIVTDGERLRPAESEVERLCAKNWKAREILGWKPKFSLEKGLISTIEWMSQNLMRYRPEAYSF
jgi:NAD dependent epimerase/dehydratase